MNLNTLRDIKWRVRSQFVSPILKILQNRLGKQIIQLLGVSNINSVSEIQEYFTDKTIAIVGNSPNLEEQNYGEEIDSKDIVIRFNKGILNLDKRTTGKKTDIWSTFTLDTLMSRKIYQQVKNSKFNIDFILTPYPFEDNNFINTNFQLLMFTMSDVYSKIDKYFMDLNIFLKLSEEIGGGFYPSSGLSILNFILNYTEAKEIYMYGFSFSTHNRISGNSHSKSHNFKKEKEIIMSLVEENKKLKINI